MTTDYRERVLDPHPALHRVYGTAFEAVRPESLQSDLLLGLLVPEQPPTITGWHQVVKVREGGGLERDIRHTYFRTFDLIDGEDLGHAYKERQYARHVTMKARVHWAKHQADVYALVHRHTGVHVGEFTHERVYFTAIEQCRLHSYTQEVLHAMRSLHLALVRHHQLQER